MQEELEGVLSLVNAGSRPVRAEVVAPPEFTLDETQVDLAPGSPPRRIPFSFRAPALNLWRAEIAVRCEGAPAERVQIACGPRPHLILAEEKTELLEGHNAPFPVVVRHREGGPAFVRRVSTRHGRLEVSGGAGSLLPGGDLAVQLQFPGGVPAPRGVFDEVLELELLNAPAVHLPLLVTVRELPRLEINATHLDFGNVAIGRSRARVVRLTNVGGGALLVEQVTMLDRGDVWELQDPGRPPLELKQGNEVDLVVTASPHRPEPTRARLLLVTNDPRHREVQVTLTATGVASLPAYTGMVGIDFGTSNSCISLLSPGGEVQPLVLDPAAHDREERLILPSCVYWSAPPSPDNLRDCTIGQPALSRAGNPLYARSIATSIKRKLGRREPERILGVPLLPQEIAARIIRHLIDAAEDKLGQTVSRAVVTVPANFTPPQVRATVQACALAGLDEAVVARNLMAEPVGAALDYLATSGQRAADSPYSLVYDFGGGTLDISIIHFHRVGDVQRLDVLATKGDTAFGGDDLTETLRRELQRRAEADLRATVPADPPERWDSIPSGELYRCHYENYTALRKLAEDMKRELSEQQESKAGCDLLVLRGRDAQTIFHGYTVKRTEYETLIRPRLKETRRLVDRALRAAGLREDQIKLVLLVGKSSRTPLVAALLDNWFGLKPVLHPEPKVCVSRGACKKGELVLNPQEGHLLAVRELDRTNCRYGIILVRELRRQFQPIIAERERFPAAGAYPRKGERLTIQPGAHITVALNRGEDDMVVDNPDISPLGEITVDEESDAVLSLRVAIRVEDHRSIAVEVDVGSGSTRTVRFEEY